jgi:hypothetical protein
MNSQEYDRIVQELQAHGHRLFSVTFVRRTDSRDGVHKAGDLRHMVCRLHVNKDVKGNDPNRKERDRNNNLITVFEMNGLKSGYKCIPLDAIIQISPAPLVQEPSWETS